jgi:hypothetical protein
MKSDELTLITLIYPHIKPYILYELIHIEKARVCKKKKKKREKGKNKEQEKKGVIQSIHFDFARSSLWLH